MVLGQEQGSVLQGFLQAAGGVGVERSVPPPPRHCSVAFGGLSNCYSEGGILGSRQAPLLLAVAVDTRGVCLRFWEPFRRDLRPLHGDGPVPALSFHCYLH